MFLLISLARKYWREGAIGALVLAVVVAVFLWERDRRELERVRLVYENPRVKIVEKVVKVQGPVRVVTRIIEKPGEVVTIVDERRGEVSETTGSDRETAPVPIEIAMKPHRSDRWLVAAQVDDGRFREAKGYSALVGYGWNNRVDVLIGGGAEGVKLQVVARF